MLYIDSIRMQHHPAITKYSLSVPPAVVTDEHDLDNKQFNDPDATYADPIDVFKRSTNIHNSNNSCTLSPYLDPVDVRKGGTLRQRFDGSPDRTITNKICGDITHTQGSVYSEPFKATAQSPDNKTKLRPYRSSCISVRVCICQYHNSVGLLFSIERG